MISYILVIIITVLMTLLVMFLVKKKMPFPIRLNGSWRKKGFFSDDWMDWMQDNFSDAKGNCTLYDYLVGRKIRQERYAKRHVVSYHTVQDDVMYDTDNADLIMVKYTKFSGTEPCAKHYFANKKHDAFFTITVRMGKPDDFSKMTIKELKNLLRDKPTLYQKFIPGAEKNEGLAEYVKRYEEAEAKRKLEEEQKRVEDETREKEKENERVRKKEEKEREKEELRKQREDEKNQVKI